MRIKLDTVILSHTDRLAIGYEQGLTRAATYQESKDWIEGQLSGILDVVRTDNPEVDDE